jgi:hypothetical protein
MIDYWSEDGDLLVHKSRARQIGAFLFFTAIVGVLFLAESTWPVGILGNLMLWGFVGLGYLSSVQRDEFDRHGRVLRRQGVRGLKWTEPLDHFTGVKVVRGRNSLGWSRICVNLVRGERFQKGTTSECAIAIYPSLSEADRNEAREWGERLAQFLDVPLQVQL